MGVEEFDDDAEGVLGVEVGVGAVAAVVEALVGGVEAAGGGVGEGGGEVGDFEGEVVDALAVALEVVVPVGAGVEGFDEFEDAGAGGEEAELGAGGGGVVVVEGVDLVAGAGGGDGGVGEVEELGPETGGELDVVDDDGDLDDGVEHGISKRIVASRS